MDSGALVAVVPNAFSRPRAALLASNVRAMLSARSLGFSSVRRDGDVIAVEADDPVFASSAIGLLFGASRVSIARRAGTSMAELVEAVSQTASGLLLRGERFVVRVGGRTPGYLARDAERAATSAIISSASRSGARPGTASAHDRAIHAHVARSHSYVGIFSDDGRGGVPFGSHAGTVACPVHDELSAVAMLECLRQGHDVLPVMAHSTDAERTRLMRPICRAVSSIPRASSRADFVRVPRSRGAARLAAAIGAAIASAHGAHAARVCVPTSPLVHGEALADSLGARVRDAGLAASFPLAGVESRIESHAAALGIGTMARHVARLCASRMGDLPDGAPPRESARQSLDVRVGPNMVHDALDSLAGGR
ncbi:MAG: hypothetical protein EB832_02250 [Thaumarchaeota archaeon S14]|nr:MAG: hypothetical protein EB832_02250 [Thaumarchaeota archaeon S14]